MMRAKLSCSLGVAVLVTVVTLTGLVSTASASTGAGSAGGAPTPPAASAASAVTPAGAPIVTSHVFAGYNEQRGGAIGGQLTVTASFLVPTLSCGSASRGIGPSTGIYNAGGKFSSAGLFLGCIGGQAHMWPYLVVNGTETNYNGGTANAQSGDGVSVTVRVTATSTRVTYVDATRSVTRTRTGAGTTQWNSPWIGDSSWSLNGTQNLGVPAFGTISFSHCLVGGQPLAAGPSTVGYRRVNNVGVVQIGLSAITAGGTAFNTLFRSH